MPRNIYEVLRPIMFRFFDKDGWDLPDETYMCSLDDYCASKGYDRADVETAALDADGINFGWLCMYDAYRRFNELGREYDAITDFREYPGEKTLFGLVREWRMKGTGVKLPEKKEE